MYPKRAPLSNINSLHLSNNQKSIDNDKIENEYLTEYFYKENVNPNANLQTDYNEIDSNKNTITYLSLNNREYFNDTFNSKREIAIKSEFENEPENIFLKNLQLNRESIEIIEKESNYIHNENSIIDWDFYREYINCTGNEIRNKILEGQKNVLSFQSKYVEKERFYIESLISKMNLFKSVIALFEQPSDYEIVEENMKFQISKLKLYQRNRELIICKFTSFQAIVKWLNGLPDWKFINYGNSNESLQKQEIENTVSPPVCRDVLSISKSIQELRGRICDIVNYSCKPAVSRGCMNNSNPPIDYYSHREFYTSKLQNHKIFIENLNIKFHYSKENYLKYCLSKMNEFNQQMIRNRISIQECQTVLQSLGKTRIPLEISKCAL